MRSEIRRARELRRDMTEPERILWSRLRRLRTQGFHLRRQYPFRGYFLDFACLSRRLAIEVDGGHHADDVQAEHDAVRDRILTRHGFRVLRFSASDVRRNLDGVLRDIIAALEDGADARQWATPPREPSFPTLAAARPVPPHGGG